MGDRWRKMTPEEIEWSNETYRWFVAAIEAEGLTVDEYQAAFQRMVNDGEIEKHEEV